MKRRGRRRGDRWEGREQERGGERKRGGGRKGGGGGEGGERGEGEWREGGVGERKRADREKEHRDSERLDITRTLTI